MMIWTRNRQQRQLGQQQQQQQQQTKERMTRRNLSTMILQTVNRASDITKYIYPYVFMIGNNDDVDKEWTMKTILTTTTTTKTRRNDKEEYVDNDSTNNE